MLYQAVVMVMYCCCGVLREPGPCGDRPISDISFLSILRGKMLDSILGHFLSSKWASTPFVFEKEKMGGQGGLFS